ncbi:MAG: leucine-rich repeat protein [Oscillospiraceae bacterium]
MKKIVSFIMAIILVSAVSLADTECIKSYADEPDILSSYNADEHEYSILDTAELNHNGTIPCYDCSSSMTSTQKQFTYSLSENDKKILQDFMNEHFTEDMTNTEKIRYTIEWLYQNIDYAATSAEYSKLSSSLAECGFVQKSGQCLQYNGALACMLAYMGYETNLIFLKDGSWQHYTCQVRINGRVFRMEAGNKGLEDGSHYMPMYMLRLETDMNTDEDKIIGQCGSSSYYTFTKSTGTLVIDGTGTVSINYDTFWDDYKDEVKSVVIQNNITEIENIFSGFSNLTDVSIPDSVTYISPYAFDDTPFINNQPDMIVLGSILYRYKGTDAYVSIPENVKYLGANIFKGCTSLESIIIPDGVENIPSCAFEECTSLSSVQLPDSITTINYNAFKNCSSLKEITIPDNVTEICDNAFSYCTSLTSINFNDKLKTINGYAFQNCENLISINIPDSVTDIQYGSFSNCYALKDVKLSENISSIPSYAFSSCTSLEEITIPDNVTSINSSAFAYCSMLKTVNMPDNITYIDNSAFSNTPFIENSENGFVIINGYLYSYSGDDTEITIPDSVTVIGCDVFQNHSEITKVTIPDSVTTINSSAFSDCSSLTDVYIPESVQYVSFTAFSNTPFLENQTDEFVIFGSHLYKYNGNASEVIIPDNIVSIGMEAFYKNENISSVVFPENLKLIESYAFYECTGLSKINLPHYIKQIDAFAFSGCAFTEVTLPDNIDCISRGLFFNCKNLKKITIPVSVKSIEYDAFSNIEEIDEYNYKYVYSLEEIDYTGNESQWANVTIADDWINHVKINFLNLAYISGDVDNDGQITSNDALNILQAVTGMVQLDNKQTKAADFDGDGNITSADALKILQTVVGM